MKTEIIRTFNITLCGIDEAQAKIIANALHAAYRPIKDSEGYLAPKAVVLREARNAFADAIAMFYMGEDA